MDGPGRPSGPKHVICPPGSGWPSQQSRGAGRYRKTSDDARRAELRCVARTSRTPVSALAHLASHRRLSGDQPAPADQRKSPFFSGGIDVHALFSTSCSSRHENTDPQAPVRHSSALDFVRVESHFRHSGRLDDHHQLPPPTCRSLPLGFCWDSALRARASRRCSDGERSSKSPRVARRAARLAVVISNDDARNFAGQHTQS